MRHNLGSILRSSLLLAAVVLALGGCGQSFDDPATAQCAAPPVAFDQPVDKGTHREVVVHFTCEGAVLTGTLYLPNNGGRHPPSSGSSAANKPTVSPMGTWSGRSSRAMSGSSPLTSEVGGQSQGECCPGDYGHFNLLTADAVGAVNALRASTDVDPQQIGFVGTSQAGWIVPRAAVASRQVAFVALASAAVLPYEQVKAYAKLTGGTGSDKPFPSKEEIAKTLQDAGPSGADPRLDLEQLTIPALWLYGTADREVPVEQSVALLNSLKGQGKDFNIVTYPDAGHGLLDSPPTDPQAPTAFVGWVLKQVHTKDA